MNKTLSQIKSLVEKRKIRVSDHGMEELRADGIRLADILATTAAAELVEDYPEAFKGPTVLALHKCDTKSIHVVWGLAKAEPNLATLITAYVPDLKKWYNDLKSRRPK